MEKNPFKFGSIVDGPYFTNRNAESARVTSLIGSANHLVMISPRRYGKSSLISKVIATTGRPVITIDLQLVTSVEDLAAQLLKRIYRIYPAQRIRQFIKRFRIIPTITLNPVTNAVDVAFMPSAAAFPQLEDVLNMMDQLSTASKKIICVMDEFQDITRLDAHLAGQLRSVLQHHRNINYVFLGSQESMIRDIFERKRSPFYHFGFLMSLGKISREDFMDFLVKGLYPFGESASMLAAQILTFTRCHPYYTQQLAFAVWEMRQGGIPHDNLVRQAAEEIIRLHDMDYERLWGVFNRTDRKLLIGMAESDLAPMSENFYRKFDLGAPSTVFSAIKRLMRSGYLIKDNNRYEIDDPFFSRWIIDRRNQ